MGSLDAWGPALVLAITVLAAAIIASRGSRAGKIAFRDRSSESRRDVDALRVALDSAEVINAYDVNMLGDPRVHQREVARVAPVNYREGAIEIPRRFLEGDVVSVDLSRMSVNSAARLVDFCSGLLAGNAGWLFRATDTVIILTPTRR